MKLFLLGGNCRGCVVVRPSLTLAVGYRKGGVLYNTTNNQNKTHIDLLGQLCLE